MVSQPDHISIIYLTFYKQKRIQMKRTERKNLYERILAGIIYAKELPVFLYLNLNSILLFYKLFFSYTSSFIKFILNEPYKCINAFLRFYFCLNCKRYFRYFSCWWGELEDNIIGFYTFITLVKRLKIPSYCRKIYPMN